MVYYAYELDDYSEESMWHHGVSGQKWGVRNGPPYPVQSGTKVRFAKSKMTESTLRAVKRKNADDRQNSRHIDSRFLKTNKILISRLSDDEIKKRIARLELENKYKDLLYENKYGKKGQESKKKDKGEQKTQSTLGKVGETLATELVKGAVGYANQRMNARAENKATISKAKAEYEANRKARDYAELDHHDQIRRESKNWIDAPKYKNQFKNSPKTSDHPAESTAVGKHLFDAWQDELNDPYYMPY